MRYLRITDDATPDQLREAITNLRGKQLDAHEPEIRAAIGDDIDDLLDMIAASV